MGSLGTRFAKQGDVNHVCKALEASAGDVLLVDSGATCHIVSTQHLSGFRVVKKHERTANLFNASGGSIVVSGVVDPRGSLWGCFPEVGRGFGLPRWVST